MTESQLIKIRELHALLREVLPIVERHAGAEMDADTAYFKLCDELGVTPNTIQSPEPFFPEPLS